MIATLIKALKIVALIGLLAWSLLVLSLVASDSAFADSCNLESLTWQYAIAGGRRVQVYGDSIPENWQHFCSVQGTVCRVVNEGWMSGTNPVNALKYVFVDAQCPTPEPDPEPSQNDPKSDDECSVGGFASSVLGITESRGCNAKPVLNCSVGQSGSVCGYAHFLDDDGNLVYLYEYDGSTGQEWSDPDDPHAELPQDVIDDFKTPPPDDPDPVDPNPTDPGPTNPNPTDPPNPVDPVDPDPTPNPGGGNNNSGGNSSGGDDGEGWGERIYNAVKALPGQISSAVSGQFNNLANAIAGVNNSVQQVGDKVDQVGDKIDQVGEKIDGLGDKLDGLTEEIDASELDTSCLECDDLIDQLNNMESLLQREFSKVSRDDVSWVLDVIPSFPKADCQPFQINVSNYVATIECEAFDKARAIFNVLVALYALWDILHVVLNARARS